jgi:hypothetical protein
LGRQEIHDRGDASGVEIGDDLMTPQTPSDQRNDLQRLNGMSGEHGPVHRHHRRPPIRDFARVSGVPVPVGAGLEISVSGF